MNKKYIQTTFRIESTLYIIFITFYFFLYLYKHLINLNDIIILARQLKLNNQDEILS